MSQPQVLIVGAGPTGLVLALRLARHGIPLRIIDKNKGPGLASRAIAVHARTLEFYQQLGFADEFIEQGIKVETLHLRERDQEVAHLTLKDMGKGLSPFPFMLGFPQDDHEKFLVKKLNEQGISVEWDVALESLTQDANGVDAILDKGSEKETCKVSYLCGCDGAHSQVRQSLGLNFPGGTYEDLFYVADVKIQNRQNQDLNVHLGAQTLALMLPVRSSGMQRIIGIVPRGHRNKTALTFEDVRPAAESLMGVKVEELNWFSTYHVHHRVAERFQLDRCFILGDAAHIHSPTGGQGMNTGIGDAVNLSWKIAHVLQNRAAPEVLETYDTERIAFARLLVSTTDRAFKLMVSDGVGGQLLRTWLIPHVFPFLTGFSATRTAIFKTLSQVRINYEGSQLSDGVAGDIHGGDRLPWICDRSNHNGDNFEALQSMDWQLHIYGDAGTGLIHEAQTLCLPVHMFVYSENAAEAGFTRNSAYLIRPDGYIALALPEQDPAALKLFADKFDICYGIQHKTTP